MEQSFKRRFFWITSSAGRRFLAEVVDQPKANKNGKMMVRARVFSQKTKVWRGANRYPYADFTERADPGDSTVQAAMRLAGVGVPDQTPATPVRRPVGRPRIVVPSAQPVARKAKLTPKTAENTDGEMTIRELRDILDTIGYRLDLRAVRQYKGR